MQKVHFKMWFSNIDVRNTKYRVTKKSKLDFRRQKVLTALIDILTNICEYLAERFVKHTRYRYYQFVHLITL